MHLWKLLPLAGLAMSLTPSIKPRAAEKPVIVISPGAWQLAEAWLPFSEKLNEAGIEHYIVPHLTVGGSRDEGLINDTEHLQIVLTSLTDRGKEIILLGHSYGGAVISGATEGFDVATRSARGQPGGVLLTAFMAAFVIPKGHSVLDLLGDNLLPWMILEDGWRVVGDKSLLPEVAFNDFTPDQVEYYSDLMTWSPLRAFQEPNLYAPWTKDVPAVYIHTSLDNALPPAQQQAMAETLSSTRLTEFTLETGHCPWISRPAETIEVLQAIIGLAESYSAEL
ncbi:hypothetical protein QTJ16_006708 [Diplocarpon rosae]|uniref:AB hydrolase-1 domain-containing protein n=1 Tax=Diplocarpon rosae TaxID=946125 RepID=A0AAD9SVV5_9HELO|nr:hypothetical protein QTJ16_006708 [Diplocarpon rosae]